MVSPIKHHLSQLSKDCKLPALKGDSMSLTTLKLISEKQRNAVDFDGIELTPGDTIVVVNDNPGGDTDGLETWDLVKGGAFVVDTVHDEDYLLSPMITLKGSVSGPVFPERFSLLFRKKASLISAVIIGYCENTETETIVSSFTEQQVEDNEHEKHSEQANKYNTNSAISFRVSFLSK